MKPDYRYSKKSFPTYIFIPGKNPHPKKEGGHMEGMGEPEANPVDLNHPELNELFRYGLDLYNFGYFWESHVYFEALWNAHQRKGNIADFFKGLIKLGAAGVKLNISESEHAEEHFARARELFSLVKRSVGDKFLGFDLEELSQSKTNVRVDPEWN